MVLKQLINFKSYFIFEGNFDLFGLIWKWNFWGGIIKLENFNQGFFLWKWLILEFELLMYLCTFYLDKYLIVLSCV